MRQDNVQQARDCAGFGYGKQEVEEGITDHRRYSCKAATDGTDGSFWGGELVFDSLPWSAVADPEAPVLE